MTAEALTAGQIQYIEDLIRHRRSDLERGNVDDVRHAGLAIYEETLRLLAEVRRMREFVTEHLGDQAGQQYRYALAVKWALEGRENDDYLVPVTPRDERVALVRMGVAYGRGEAYDHAVLRLAGVRNPLIEGCPDMPEPMTWPNREDYR